MWGDRRMEVGGWKKDGGGGIEGWRLGGIEGWRLGDRRMEVGG